MDRTSQDITTNTTVTLADPPYEVTIHLDNGHCGDVEMHVSARAGGGFRPWQVPPNREREAYRLRICPDVKANLPAEERKDLIEDLNEDGFPDPRNLTREDLPLIESRMELIEQLAPDAMDEVNADAFAEACKDLVNMYQRLTSR